MKLTVEHAGFSYKKGTPVIRDMNFSASSGELVAILGPNGAGKTTLLRCMMGFLNWDEGRCLIDGEDVRTMPARKLWQRVSYVPQARGAFASMTARDMILLGCTNRIGVFSVPGSSERKLVGELAEQMGIGGLLDKRCTEISGGELQMVLIARALAAKPELLILDEPESNLDFKNQLIVLDTMSRLSAEGMCCIFNTHYPTHALMRASKSLILQKGGEAIFGDTTTVLTEETIEKAFGVKAVIGEIETTGNVYHSILPLRIIRDKSETGHPASENAPANGRRIAVISLLFREDSLSDKINALLREYSDGIIGRTGIPYRDGGVNIVNITLDAPQERIESLAHRLNILPGMNAKTTYADEQ